MSPSQAAAEILMNRQVKRNAGARNEKRDAERQKNRESR